MTITQLAEFLDSSYQRLSAKLEQIWRGIETLLQGQVNIMTAITDWAAQEQAVLQQIQTGIQTLDTALQNFQPTSLSAGDQAALNALLAQSKALATMANTMPTTPAAGGGTTPPTGGSTGGSGGTSGGGATPPAPTPPATPTTPSTGG